MPELLNWQKKKLPEGNRVEENFYATKYMMKPPGLGPRIPRN
jgi:hypothetical protein